MDHQTFERSLPASFREFFVDGLGGVVTPGGDGIMLYNGFDAVGTMSLAEAESLTQDDRDAIKRVFDQWTERRRG